MVLSKLYDEEGTKFKIDKCLSNKRRSLVVNEIDKFQPMFITHPARTTRATLKPSVLPITDDEPVWQPGRRFSSEEWIILRRKINGLERKGLLRRQQSLYKSPIILKERPNGTFGMYTNYTGVNAGNIAQRMDLVPELRHFWSHLQSKEYFTLLDLGCGFFQIPLAPQSQLVTGIKFGGIEYVYTALPRDIKGSRNILQKQMEFVLKDMVDEELVIYLEKILIFGDSFESVLDSTVRALEKLQSRNFKLRTGSCYFLYKSVEFAGFRISPNKRQSSDRNLATILNTPLPRTMTDLRAFLGRTNYQKSLIKHYSEITAPLTDMLGEQAQEVELQWSSIQKEKFAEIKEKLAAKPSVGFFKSGEKTFLKINVLDRSYEGALYQIDSASGEQIPIEYHSIKLGKDKIKWSLARLELFAMVQTCSTFKRYLENEHFTIITEHLSESGLDILRRNSVVEEKLAAELDGYKYTLKKVSPNED